jgi:hypothetical protein
MTREQFAKLMYALAGNFGTEIPPATLDVWFSMTKEDGLAYPQMQAAVKHIIRTKTDGYGRMPTYAEIFTAIVGKPVAIEDKALCEANRVLEYLRTNGARTAPEWADRVTNKLMTTRWNYTGWAQSVLESELKWWVKEFCEAYRAMADQDAVPAIEAPKRVLELASGIGRRA